MRRLLSSAALLLAACGGATDPAANMAATDPSSNGTALPSDAPSPAATQTPSPTLTPTPGPVAVPPSDSDGDTSATEGGDGSPIMLAALQPEDTRQIEGELGCDFTRRSGETIFVALANVVDSERAQGVYRIGDYADTVVMRRPGGFDALSAGAAFGGRGMTLTVERGARIPTDSEQTSHIATLKAQRGDGAERSYDGSWTCGP